MTENLVFVENEDHVQHCVKWYDELDENKKIIALSPFAMYELDKQKTPYHIPEEYYRPEELYELGINNYKKVEKICSIIDKKIHEKNHTLQELQIKPAFFNFYSLKIIYDACSLRLFQLSKIFDREKPDYIYFYDTKIYSGQTSVFSEQPPLLFNNRESIYSQLIKLYEGTYHLEKLLTLSQDKHYIQPSVTVKKIIIKWLESHPKAYNLAIAIKGKNWKKFFLLKNDSKTPDTISALLFLGGYNWNEGRLDKEGISPIYKIKDDIADRINSFLTATDSKIIGELCQHISDSKKLRELFKLNDIDFFPVVEKRFEFLIEKLMQVCLQTYKDTNNLIKKQRIRVVLGSSFSSCVSKTVSQAAKNLDVPVILWQHGAYGYFDSPIQIYNDIIPADILFSFGEGIADRYRDAAKKLNKQIIPIGSSALDHLYGKRDRKRENMERALKLDLNKKNILYVTTNFYQNYFYVWNSQPFSDNLFWLTQQKIIEKFSKFDNYNFIIKMHPNLQFREPPVRAYVEDRKYKNFFFVRNEYNFTDLLTPADAIVIDFPTTSLLQSLTTNKPIFAYFGHLNIDDDARKLLDRRIYCSNVLTDFLNILNGSLSTGFINIDKNLDDNEFLKKYGTYQHDGKSLERSLQTIFKIVNLKEM